MKIFVHTLIVFCLLSFTTDTGSYYTKTKKKADKQLSKLWETEVPNLTYISIPSSKITELGIKQIELYSLKSESDEKLGYVYFTEAPSKMLSFIYMTIFDNNLKVHHVEVLRYPENYGAEICSKRFLQQFKGKYNGQKIEYNVDIDGISGATISSKSITRSLKIISKNMVKLKEHKII